MDNGQETNKGVDKATRTGSAVRTAVYTRRSGGPWCPLWPVTLQTLKTRDKKVPSRKETERSLNNRWSPNILGLPVAFLHGANAPLLQKMIEREMRLERQALKGEISRETIAFEEAVPGTYVDDVKHKIYFPRDIRTYYYKNWHAYDKSLKIL